MYVVSSLLVSTYLCASLASLCDLGPQPTFRNFWIVWSVGSLRPTSLIPGSDALHPSSPPSEWLRSQILASESTLLKTSKICLNVGNKGVYGTRIYPI